MTDLDPAWLQNKRHGNEGRQTDRQTIGAAIKAAFLSDHSTPIPFGFR
jgi:hypothetical protein